MDHTQRTQLHQPTPPIPHLNRAARKNSRLGPDAKRAEQASILQEVKPLKGEPHPLPRVQFPVAGYLDAGEVNETPTGHRR